MLNKDEVKHIAKLARIELKNHEVERYQTELSAILDFVSELSKADTTGVEPIRQISGLESIFRKDEPRNLYEVRPRKLIEQAPNHKDGYVVVPEVMKGK